MMLSNHYTARYRDSNNAIKATLVWLLLWLAPWLNGCAASDNAPAAPQTPVLSDLRITAGNNQRGTAGRSLEEALEIIALDQYSEPLAGIEVTFEVRRGGGLLRSNTALTTLAGRASTTLTLGPEPGVQQVVAKAEGLTGLPPTFSLVATAAPPGAPASALAPARLALQAADSVLVADGVSTTQLTAIVLDSLGNGLEGQTVVFNTTAGLLQDGDNLEDAATTRSAFTDAAGRATVHYRSPVNAAGLDAVAVEVQAGPLAAATQITLWGTRLQLTTEAAALAADGLARMRLNAILTDANGRPAPFVPVDFGASLGTVEPPQVFTDAAGRATAQYRGVASGEDLGRVEIRARAAGNDTAAYVNLLGVRLRIAAAIDTIAADGNAQAALAARLERSDGVALTAATVSLTTTLGTLSSTAVLSDGDGVAHSLLVAGTQPGVALIEASYGSITAHTAVVLSKGPPASIVLIGIDPPAIGVRGAGANETAIATFEVRDGRGNAVADGETVLFRLDAPQGGDERIDPAQTATVAGRVQAAVRSGVLARTVRLIAAAPLAAGDTVRSTPVPIAIHGGLPHRDHFSLAARPVNLAGRVLLGLQSSITAFVFDRFSNPVAPGTSVRFRTDGGGIQGATQANANGQGAVLLFTAEPIPPGPGFLATVTGQTVDQDGQQIEASTTVLFSGPTAPIQLFGEGGAAAFDGSVSIADGASRIIPFRVSDISGHPLMGGSRITVTSDVARVSGDGSVVIPDTRSGHTDYALILSDPSPAEDPPLEPQRGSVLIQVRSPNGDRQLSFGVTVD